MGSVEGGRRTAGPALRIFLWSRAAIWALAAGVVLVFERHLNPERGEWETGRFHDAGVVVDVLARWDSGWLLQVAEQGYSWPSATPAFLPLYPLLTGALGRALLGHYVVAGIIVSLAAGAVACVLLYRLALPRLGDAGARRTVLFLAVSPMSLFLGVVYTEALFLALAVGCFLLAERGRLGWAALVAGLAMLTRAQGLALLPALALFAWQSPDRVRSLASMAVAPALFLAYPLTLWLWIGRPLAFLDAEAQWERHISPAGPAGGMARAVIDVDLVELAFAAVMGLLAIVAWRRFGSAYGAYACGVLALAMSVPSDRLGGLYSLPRLSLVAFPCFMAAAAIAGGRPRAGQVVVLVSGALLALFVVRWALWYWVS